MTPSLLKATSQFTALPLPRRARPEQGAGELNPLGGASLPRRMTPADLERRFQTGDPSFDGRVAFGINAATRIGARREPVSTDPVGRSRDRRKDWVEFYTAFWGNQILWGDHFGRSDPGDRVDWADNATSVVWGNQLLWGDSLVWGDRPLTTVGPPPF